MARQRLIKISVIALCLLILIVVLLPVYNHVSIKAPMIGIPLFIARNGQEVPPEQIRSVRYLIDVDLPKPAREMQADKLREAPNSHDYHIIGAPFSIYRYGGLFSTSTEVKPEYRSVFLRITFADGKTISLSCPIISDTRENVAMYVDLGDDVQH